MALAKVEEAYRHEKETKEAIEEVIRSCSLYQLQDTLDAADEGTDENRLLPAMNKIWPFLVVCIRNRNPVVRDRTYPWIVTLTNHETSSILCYPSSKIMTLLCCRLLGDV